MDSFKQNTAKSRRLSKSLKETILNVYSIWFFHKIHKIVAYKRIISITNKAIADIRLRPRCEIAPFAPPTSQPIIDSSNACNHASAPVVCRCTDQSNSPLLGVLNLSGRCFPQNCPFVTLLEEDRATAIGDIHKIRWRLRMWFRRYPRGQTDTHTHTHRRTHHNTSQPLLQAK